MYIGIDLGTSSVKILVMGKNGKVKNSVSKPYSLSYPKPSWAEQDPNEWWEVCKNGIKEVLEGVDKSKIKGISFSGQMHGLVILDKKDEVIRPAILWCDQRTEPQCKYLNETVGIEKISKYTGNEALTGFTAPKILWMKENENENFNKIEKIMLPKDYISYKLSGIHATDMSDASGMLLLDVENRKWSQEMIDICGIKKENLGKLYESYESIGLVKSEISEEFGIPKDVQVIIGGGDQAVGAVGVGAVEEGTLSVALGSSGVVFSSTENYVVDEKNRLHSFCHANGKYHQMGVMLSAAASYKWWVEQINGSKEYSKFNSEAEKIEIGSENLYFMPYLMGERTPHNDANAKGAFIGLGMNHKKGHMTRAVLEGVSFGLRDSLELLKDMNVKMEKVRVSGGGATSSIWKQMLADIFNIEITTINSTEGPAYGAAILAAVGCGEFKSVDEACKNLIEETEKYKPILENVAKYDTHYQMFKDLYPTLKRTFKKLK